MNILTITGLSKSFGEQTVIHNLNLTVPEGAIFGFVGQNGAGKTTTMKMVLGLLKADSGTIEICGKTVSYEKMVNNQYIGYLPDVPEFYSYMKPMEYLTLCGEITGLSKHEIITRSENLLSLVGLDNGKKRIGWFSRGMKQRLGIAQALLSQPKLLICDEPTSALDPIGRKEILDILLEIKNTTTVIFSTHILTDVERICDHVAILNRGSIAVCGTLSEIKAQHGRNRLRLEFSNTAEVQKFKTCKTIQPLLKNAEETKTEIILHDTDCQLVQHIVIAALAENNLCPIKMERVIPSLETMFMEVVK